ncbi:MAG: HEPN domain-containing protein [bacterium]
MENSKVSIDVDKIVIHYKESSEEDYITMINLFNSKSYNWSLFIGHISLEKLLKALYVKLIRSMHLTPTISTDWLRNVK